MLGIFMGPLLIILGLGMAAYSWLTTPRQYLLYRDMMVIIYGMPRTRTISFAEISHIELLALPLGERLRIRMVSGGRMMLMMRDPGTFRGHLEDALSRYHGEQSGASFVEGAVLERGVESPGLENEEGPEPGFAEWTDTETYAGSPAEADTVSSRPYTEERRAGSYTETPEVEYQDAPAAAETNAAAGTYNEATHNEVTHNAEGQSSGSYSDTPEVSEQVSPAPASPAPTAETYTDSGSYVEVESGSSSSSEPSTSESSSDADSDGSRAGAYTESESDTGRKDGDNRDNRPERPQSPY